MNNNDQQESPRFGGGEPKIEDNEFNENIFQKIEIMKKTEERRRSIDIKTGKEKGSKSPSPQKYETEFQLSLT